MIYHIEMTPEQHAWLVEDLIVECHICEVVPNANRAITLDELYAIKDAVKNAPCFRPSTLDEKQAVLDKIDPEDGDEMDYITEPDGDGGVWFLTWHYIKENGDDTK